MNGILYKDYQIIPAPLQLAETGEWTTSLVIGRDKGYEWAERPFSAANTYKTKEEAIEHCINFGKQIIDGKYEDCTVADL